MQVFNFTAEGLQEAKVKPNLPIGSRIFAFGAGMADYIYAVCGDADQNGAQKCVKMGTHYEGDYFSPFQTVEKYARPISKKFGIGFYWDDVENFVFTPEEVAEAIQRGEAAKLAQQEAEKAQAEKDRQEREDLPKLYPFLTPNPQDDAKVTKLNMLAFLKHAFPGIKFSARKESYSTYNVTWTNGPTNEDVSKITKLFIDHETSYCGDFRDSAPTNFTRTFGGFKYIFEYREVTEDVKNLKNKLAKELPNRDIYEVGNILHRIISKTKIPNSYTSVGIERTERTCGNIEDFYRLIFTGEAPKTDKTTEAPEGVKVLKYSEKSIVITGNTYPIKDQLKNAGGKFNKFLSCGPGWIFPMSELENIKTLLTTLKK